MSNLPEHEQILSRKNTLALQASLSLLNGMVYKQQETINLLQNSISVLSSRLIALEQILLSQKIASMGHGPSVK